MDRNPEKLSCISIILCDEIYRDEATQKLVIIGTFNRVWTPKLPCRHRLTVLFSVTNGKGEYDLRVSIEHEKSGTQVIELGGSFVVDDPLRISDINLEFRDLVLQEQGKYWIILKADQEILQQRPFWVEVARADE